MELYPCKKDTEAAFLSHDKFPCKIHSRFRWSLNLCDRTQECLLKNDIEREKVQDRSMIYKILKKTNFIWVKERFT